MALIGGSMIIIQKYLLNSGINWKAMISVNAFYFFLFGSMFTYYYRNDIVPEVKRLDSRIFIILAITILFGTFIMSILNYNILERNNAYIVSGLSLVAPIFTVILARVFLGEDIHCKGILGILIMIAGSWLIIQAKQETDKLKH
jgi:drug/metabolite transporter (DMT)-like permease